jgi:Mg2+/citrate symporter
MVHGIAQSYWIFMLVFAALIAYNYRKQKAKQDEIGNESKPKSKAKRSKN